MTEAVRTVLVHLDWVILGYFAFVNGFYLVLVVLASLDLRRHAFEVRGAARHRLLSSAIAPRISMLVPAYNEEATIEESVSALLTLDYPGLEIVVVDDGSTDDTLSVLDRAFSLDPVHPIFQRVLVTAPIRSIQRSRSYPGLVVVSKENGGKADSLNVGLCVAAGELACAIDADTIIESDALQRLVRPFLRSDEVVAAGATIRVANGSDFRHGRVERVRAARRPLTGFQTIEYLRAFLFGRIGWNRLGGNLIISGAFGLFRRDAALAAGGYSHTVGEDIELIVRLRRASYELGQPGRVEFVPDPVAWTLAPETTRILRRQRDRWHRGLSDALWRHRRLLCNPRYGVLGMVAMPIFVLVELLAPVVEAIGLVALVAGLALGAVNVSFAVLFLLVAYGLGVVLSLLAILIEEVAFARYDRLSDRLILLAWALLESLGYRQLTVVWRLQGIVGFLRGRSEWGNMERRPFTAAEPLPRPR